MLASPQEVAVSFFSVFLLENYGVAIAKRMAKHELLGADLHGISGMPIKLGDNTVFKYESTIYSKL